MARTDTLGHFLTDVADAIREKKGSSSSIPASQFDTEISNLSGGYKITVSVTNGTYTGATVTFDDNNAYIYVEPDLGYYLPTENITVTGASFSSANGEIRLYNATGDITVTATCESYGGVKCIIASRGQYIITDYIPNDKTKIEMEMNKSEWAEQWDVMWGSENKFTFMQYGWSASNTQLQLEMYGNSQPTGIDIQFNTKVKVILDASIPLFKYGEYTYTPTFGSTPPTGPMIIFGKRRNGSTAMDHYSSYKLYNFKIYDNGNLVRDYRPALDNNNVPCLFETVSATYLYNAGTGTFGYEAE